MIFDFGFLFLFGVVASCWWWLLQWYEWWCFSHWIFVGWLILGGGVFIVAIDVELWVENIYFLM